MTHEDRMFLLAVANSPADSVIGIDGPVREHARNLVAQEVGKLVAQAERKPKPWVRKRPRVTNLG